MSSASVKETSPKSSSAVSALVPSINPARFGRMP